MDFNPIHPALIRCHLLLFFDDANVDAQAYAKCVCDWEKVSRRHRAKRFDEYGFLLILADKRENSRL